MNRTPTVAIVGAGMSGLCMGIKLKRAGIDSFTIYEKAESVGGTWRDNTYPGLSCDVPSRFYQYSFELNPDWSQVFAPGPEIWGYFERAADKYGLRPHLKTGTEVTGARYDGGRWTIETKGTGPFLSADFVVSACGVLHHPRLPEIEGMDSFAGASFHSARWDHDVKLAGKRIAVIGTGSTGVQIVTDLAGIAGRLAHFQRTPQWILPAPNRPYGRWERRLQRRFPWLGRFEYGLTQWALRHTFSRAVVRPGWQRRLIGWICRMHLKTVRDPQLRHGLTPDYEPMCKRLVVSTGFYSAMQRPNVELVREGIERIDETGIVTSDGRHHDVDVIVYATGFDSHAYTRPIDVVGEGGIDLDDVWSEGPRAHRTVAIAGFPNFFMLMGPHSPVGNYSLVAIAEAQADFAMRWIRMWQDGRLATVAPSAEAMDRFNRDMRGAMPDTVWTTGCDSWYLGKDGKPEVWPWTPERHQAMLRDPDPREFEVTNSQV
ncbi:MAG TPA: NAD(P)/FAD-dependent oxidoreductase [Thermoleophilaceae bacterium]